VPKTPEQGEEVAPFLLFKGSKKLRILPFPVSGGQIFKEREKASRYNFRGKSCFRGVSGGTMPATGKYCDWD
jgi:hypothetical protein